MKVSQIQPITKNVEQAIGSVIIGKSAKIRLVLAAFLSGGHVLLEDVPGTGKTMLAKAFARCFDCQFGRIQFTPDLLPSELTGINFYHPQSGEFSFRKGSLFTNILLADEINRATPRTQSGLLESMEELQISVDGKTYSLPNPYFVIATQNPIETQGTFPLPEAQLDRFCIQLSLGYPSAQQTVQIIKSQISQQPLDQLQAVCDTKTLQEMQQAIQTVFIHDEVYQYATALAEATRNHESILLGVSTRGTLALIRLTQAYAACEGRDFVTPDDLKYLMPFVFAHRMVARTNYNRAEMLQVLQEVSAQVPVPVENWKVSSV